MRKWLIEHPGVEMISRDRGGDCAKGSREGAPQQTALPEGDTIENRQNEPDSQVKINTEGLLAKLVDSWTVDEKNYLERLFKLCPDAEKARKIALEFQDMMKQKKLDPGSKAPLIAV